MSGAGLRADPKKSKKWSRIPQEPGPSSHTTTRPPDHSLQKVLYRFEKEKLKKKKKLRGGPGLLMGHR